MTTPSDSLQQVSRETRVRALTAAVIVLLVGVTLVAVGAVAYLTLKAGDQSERNYEVIKEVKVGNARLVDCTEPGGECFEESQKRMGQAVSYLNERRVRDITAALSCIADGITQQYDLLACTVKRSDQAE